MRRHVASCSPLYKLDFPGKASVPHKGEFRAIEPATYAVLKKLDEDARSQFASTHNVSDKRLFKIYVSLFLFSYKTKRRF